MHTMSDPPALTCVSQNKHMQPRPDGASGGEWPAVPIKTPVGLPSPSRTISPPSGSSAGSGGTGTPTYIHREGQAHGVVRECSLLRYVALATDRQTDTQAHATVVAMYSPQHARTDCFPPCLCPCVCVPARRVAELAHSAWPSMRLSQTGVLGKAPSRSALVGNTGGDHSV
jgi:hypothetical protein